MGKVSIDWWIGELRRHGASDVDQYEAKLRSFRDNEQKVFEFIAEARAALLFLRNGIKVVMQDRPDLRLSFNGETIYAEVKHYNEKETDRNDAKAMAATPFEFIQVGNVVDDEGLHGWQQMCATAIKKAPQDAPGFPNILVFVNHSDALDLHLRSAVNEFDDAVRKAGASSPLRKLSGMMMLKNYQSVGWNATNVEFCYTSYALHAVDPKFVHLMTQGQLA
jgi:hypothetical protein